MGPARPQRSRSSHGGDQGCRARAWWLQHGVTGREPHAAPESWGVSSRHWATLLVSRGEPAPAFKQLENYSGE